MHPELIKAKIGMKGMTLADVARNAQIGEHSVRAALRRPSLAGEKAIAEALNLNLHELWPERWTADGRRIRPRWAHLYREQT
ncbi:helix-turn-helix domain-containing protein [Neisseria sp. S1]|uniref:helix-turn-helix domain-containing protein n=1 Tax=Neisseria sp. S1 TaxID=3318354 RepID=UPI003A87D8A8